MDTTFTPLLSLAGGGLIGLAAVLLMLGLGRIMGATGLVAGLLAPASGRDWAWRAALVLGMATGPLVWLAATGTWPQVSVAAGPVQLVLGGLAVGIGVTFGGGCTSGHGICGLARLSPRSLVATLTFMASAALTVYVIRHVIGA
ncbi:YeeE/YedE family protein [Xinfangfangia pollutisoli]|uniref:YeeE/YedE family protein n=1 Tax=Xinfangfangia pollutisoli TaxID=2865960 RepID=UPI001CD35AAD|nr:YeeE/YedE family protein [Xinfangfangia pollutisoli]